MSRWPMGYASGPQKLTKVESVDEQALRDKFLNVDFSQIEQRVLASMTKAERKQALAACYGAGQIKQGIVAGEYPPPDVLAQLDQIGVRGGTVTGRFTSSEPSFKELPKPWKPTKEDKEPPF